MSTILKALRRVEDDRNLQTPPPLREQVAGGGNVRRAGRSWLLAVLALLAGVAVGVALLLLWPRTGDEPEIAATPAQTPATASAPTPTVAVGGAKAASEAPGELGTSPPQAGLERMLEERRAAAARREKARAAARSRRAPANLPSAAAPPQIARSEPPPAPTRALPAKALASPVDVVERKQPAVAEPAHGVAPSTPAPAVAPPEPEPISAPSASVLAARSAAGPEAVTPLREPSPPTGVTDLGAPSEPSSPPVAAVVPEPPAPPAGEPAAAQTAPADLPTLLVVKTIWHPRSERRLAEVEVDGDEVRTLREGDSLGPLVVEAIGPSGVVFRHGDVELDRRVGQAD